MLRMPAPHFSWRPRRALGKAIDNICRRGSPASYRFQAMYCINRFKPIYYRHRSRPISCNAHHSRTVDYPIRLADQLRAHLRALRKQRGLTQAQLGQKLGIGQVRVAEIEAKPGLVSVDQLIKLLSALGATLVLRDLIGSAVAPSPHSDHGVRLSRTPDAPSAPRLKPVPVPGGKRKTVSWPVTAATPRKKSTDARPSTAKKSTSVAGKARGKASSVQILAKKGSW